jgi:hypothetical protein
VMVNSSDDFKHAGFAGIWLKRIPWNYGTGIKLDRGRILFITCQ